MLKILSLGVALVLGMLSLANGLFMLVSPEDWYFAIPGVTTTGPFNQHFIRDIGLIFLFVAAAFLIGTARSGLRVVLWGGATLWLASHALFHFWEVAAGICTPDVLVRDFPAVTLPAFLGILITLWALQAAPAATTADA